MNAIKVVVGLLQYVNSNNYTNISSSIFIRTHMKHLGLICIFILGIYPINAQNYNEYIEAAYKHIQME